MNVRLLLLAQLDVIDDADWYDQQAAGTGARFFAAVEAFVASVGTYPRRFARVSRAPKGREVRRGQLSGFPFTSVYEVTAIEVVLLAVTHARSVQQPWRTRLP